MEEEEEEMEVGEMRGQLPCYNLKNNEGFTDRY
jgi:hypothetical protein